MKRSNVACLLDADPMLVRLGVAKDNGLGLEVCAVWIDGSSALRDADRLRRVCSPDHLSMKLQIGGRLFVWDWSKAMST